MVYCIGDNPAPMRSSTEKAEEDRRAAEAKEAERKSEETRSVFLKHCCCKKQIQLHQLYIICFVPLIDSC